MKRLLFVIPSIMLILGAIPVAVSALQPKPIEPVIVTQKPVEASVTPKVVEVVQEPTPAPEAPQEASIVVTTPTNEDLIAQYGWGQGSNRVSIDYIIQMFPKKFTDSEREASFAYLNSIVLTNAQIGDTERRMNSIDMVKWYFQEAYMDESWVNVGRLAGIAS